MTPKTTLRFNGNLIFAASTKNCEGFFNWPCILESYPYSCCIIATISFFHGGHNSKLIVYNHSVFFGKNSKIAAPDITAFRFVGLYLPFLWQWREKMTVNYWTMIWYLHFYSSLSTPIQLKKSLVHTTLSSNHCLWMLFTFLEFLGISFFLEFLSKVFGTFLPPCLLVYL